MICERLKIIKLVVSDVDGTLLNSENTIPIETAELIRKLSEKNIAFSIASGRSPFSLQKLVSDLKINIPIIAAGGSLIIDPSNNKDIFSMPLAVEQVDQLVFIARKQNLDFTYFSKGKIFADVSDDYWEVLNARQVQYMQSPYKTLGLTRNVSFDINHIEKVHKIDIHKINGYINNLLSELKKINPPIEYSIFQGRVEITSKGVNKGSALRKLANYLNVNITNTLAIGDEMNDIPLIKEAGLSFAVENGSDELKKYADYIAPFKNSAGVAWILQQLISM